jgi:hypothetical protein
MNGLSPEAQEVLKMICAAYAAQPFAVEKADSLRPPTLCRAEQRLALKELRQAGMLELRQKIWGEKLYQIPVRQLAAIHQHFFSMSPLPVAGDSVMLKLAAGSGLTGELFRALLFTAREGLPLTAKGVIHKKNISRLAALFSLREEHLRGLIPGDAYAETQPLTAMVIVDLMLMLGLISRQNEAYMLEMERLDQWFALSEPQMNHILYNLILNRYGLQEPVRQHFRYCISAGEFAPSQWFSLPDILDRMHKLNLAADDPETGVEASCLAWFSCLAGFGWCELGYSDYGDWCFRWMDSKPSPDPGGGAGDNCVNLFTADRPAPGCGTVEGLSVQAPTEKRILQDSTLQSFIVQPDFEVLVPPEVPYTTRWMLGGCAKLLHSDDLWSFRLTRERLEHAAEQGLSPETVISWLAAHAQGGLPEQVDLSLRQWAKGIGRTAFSEVILLSCNSEADGADIAAHPRLGGSLTRVGPLHFIVRGDQVEQVRKELAAAGMAPPRIIGGREGSPKQKLFNLGDPCLPLADFVLPAPDPKRGILGGEAVYQPLPLSSAEVEESIWNGEDNVPQMWIKEWRKYHGSTAQKVMEQALKWGIKVRLSIRDEVCDFIPGRISGHPWRVSGCLLDSDSVIRDPEMELAPGDWDEMKLLIPAELRNSSSAGASGYVMIR